MGTCRREKYSSAARDYILYGLLDTVNSVLTSHPALKTHGGGGSDSLVSFLFDEALFRRPASPGAHWAAPVRLVSRRVPHDLAVCFAADVDESDVASLPKAKIAATRVAAYKALATLCADCPPNLMEALGLLQSLVSSTTAVRRLARQLLRVPSCCSSCCSSCCVSRCAPLTDDGL